MREKIGCGHHPRAYPRFKICLSAVSRKKGLREKTLVTWEKTDPEDPWNWLKTTRWCKRSLLGSYIWVYPLTPCYADITAVVASAVIQVTMSSATVTGEFGVRNGT
jgi:hypothetical protein